MRTCPHCGRVVTDAEVQTCPTCGLSLAADQSAPQQAEPTPVYAAPPAFSAPPNQPPANQPPYAPAYGAPTNYPGAYQPGANWQPSSQPARRPWGRITAGVVVALVVIAIVASVYNQTHAKPISSASATETANASANATVTAAIAASNTLLADPLTSNANGWPNDIHCYFAQDGYHDGGGYICYAPIDGQVDGTETVTVSQVAGPDTSAYGLIFRMEGDNNYYEFAIDSNSRWIFFKVVNGKTTRLHDYTTNVAINGGLNTKNTLSVTMSGSKFELRVNSQKVGVVNDASLPEGKWALAADRGLNAVFTDYLAKSA
jgi:hypothetical protein